MSYRHDQFGTLAVGTMISIAVLLAVFFVATGFLPLLIILLISFFLVLMLFHSLSVEVTRDHLRLRFGIGLVGKTFATGEMVDVYPVRNKWYYGFGIRLTPHGWLFNVSGLDAVEIVMRSGRHYRIGTDEPQALAAAVKRAIDDSAHQA